MAQEALVNVRRHSGAAQVSVEFGATAAPPVRVVIADDHPIFRDGLRRLLSIEPGFSVVAEAADPVGAVEMVRRHRPDLLLLDLMMPGGELLALRELSKDPATTRIIVLTAAIDRDEELAAVQLGARGIVTKETATGLLVKCMRCAMAGQYSRELEIVAAIVDGAATGRLPSSSASARRRSRLRRQLRSPVTRRRQLAVQLEDTKELREDLWNGHGEPHRRHAQVVRGAVQ